LTDAAPAVSLYCWWWIGTVNVGRSPTVRTFDDHCIPDGYIDIIKHILFTDAFTKPYSQEHVLVKLSGVSLCFVGLFVSDVHKL